VECAKLGILLETERFMGRSMIVLDMKSIDEIKSNLRRSINAHGLKN